MRFVTWRFWAVALMLVAIWVALGHYYDSDSWVVTWLARVGVIGSFLASVAFLLVYTIMGLLGSAKWWATNFGLRIMLFPMAVAVYTGTFAWALLFRHGMIDTPVTAWIYLGGYMASLVLLVWGCVLWLRQGTRNGGSAE